MENKVRLSYGNLNRFKAFAQHGDKKDRFYYSLAYSKQHDDGRDDWNNGSDSDAVLVKGGYDSQGLKVDLNFYHDWAWREIQRPTEDNTVYDAKWKYDPLNTMLISATLAKQWNESQTTSAGFYRGRIDADLQKESFSKSGFLSVHRQEDEAIQADLRHIITTQNNTFRVGGQAIWWKTPTGQFYYENKPREEELYSVYLYDQYALSENFKIDAGARMDKKHITKGIDKFAPTQTTTALIEDKWAEPYYTLTLGAAYQLAEKWEFSFRTSYVEQSTDNFILTVDDKSLPAEKQLRYEVGLTGQIHPAFNPTLTLFYYDISNLKTSVGSIRIGPDDVNIYDAIDVGRSGFELDFRGRLWDDHFSYGLTYTYQTSNSDKDDREMPNHMASLRLGYTLNPFQANLMFLYMAKYDAARFAVDKKVHEVGGIKRVDANISYGFNVGKAKMRATLFGQNLTDQHYETRLGWEDVGLTFGLELSADF
jgi:iron complex outermembrane receptor protein